MGSDGYRRGYVSFAHFFSIFAYAKTKTQISFAVIHVFVFATRIVQSLYFLNPDFQASSYLLWLYSPVCVGHGRKPRRPVFSRCGSFVVIKLEKLREKYKLQSSLCQTCITQTCPCNIQQYFTAVKMLIFR